MNDAAHPESRIIVALDVDSKEKAISLVEQLPGVQTFKIGLKLFTSQGPALLEDIQSLGKSVFLDLKLHDIPNTVAGAVSMAIRHNVAMMTLHASGGQEMLAKAAQTAVQEAQACGHKKPLLLAVTVLTSLKDDDLQELGIPSNAAEQVKRLAGLAKSAGVDGVVCSPKEIELIKSQFSRDFLVVTPGIRPAWAAAQDQKRIMTPSEAVQKGADYLVIGRPIIAAESPHEAFLKICGEMT